MRVTEKTAEAVCVCVTSLCSPFLTATRLLQWVHAGRCPDVAPWGKVVTVNQNNEVVGWKTKTTNKNLKDTKRK